MYKIYFNNNFILLLSKDSLPPKDVALCEFNITKVLQKVENNKNVAVLCDDVDEIFELFSSFFDVHEAAGGLVRSEKNNFLMIYRNDFWDLPKGHLEKGEGMEQCAKREVSEECGIQNLELERFLCVTMHIYPLKQRLVLKKTSWYMMGASQKQELLPQKEEGITKVKWKNIDEIRDIRPKTYASISDVLDYVYAAL